MDIDGFKRPIRRPSTQKQARVRTNIPASAVRAPQEPVGRFPLPRYEAPERPTRVVRKKYWNKKKLLVQSVALFLAVILGTGGFLTWQAYVKIHKVFRGTSVVAALRAQPAPPQLLNGEGDGRVNILLLGVGGPGHDGPDLTDTIVIFSVDPVNNKATMVSIPRDLWVKQPVAYFGAEQKINAAYESAKYDYLGHMDPSDANAAAVEAGFKNLDQVVQTVTGVKINYHMLVNFQAFRQAVNTVGGVDINVPTELYDPTMAWENHWNPVLAQAGPQHMTGAQALLYARSRETTSDFARGQRQRQLLLALKDKALTLGTLSNPAKIEQLMNAFGDNVYSDLSTQGAERLYSIMKKVGDGNIQSVGLTDPPHQLIKTGRVGTASVDVPTAGTFDYDDIQSYIRSQIPDGFITKEHAPIAVLGPTKTAAVAAQTLLQSYGYNVISAGVATGTGVVPTIVDLSHGKAPYTLHYLENRYHVRALTSVPAGVKTATQGAKFVIMVTK